MGITHTRPEMKRKEKIDEPQINRSFIDEMLDVTLPRGIDVRKNRPHDRSKIDRSNITAG